MGAGFGFRVLSLNWISSVMVFMVFLCEHEVHGLRL